MNEARSGFNLIDDSWIPIDGHDLSIRDALTRAHEMPPWFDSSQPQASVAIVRLLAAIAYRVTGLDAAAGDPDRFDEAISETLSVGRFTARDVNDYLDRWRDRFWLIPPDGSNARPFMQDPELDEAQRGVPPRGIGSSKLAPDNAPSYRWDNQIVGHLTPAEAARYLLAFMWYGPGGFPDGTHPRHAPGAKWQVSPLRGSASIHPCGDNFFATLLLHLVPADPGATTFASVGIPDWEMNTLLGADIPLSPGDGILAHLAGRWDKTALLVPAVDHLTIERVHLATGRRRGDVTERDPYVLHWERKDKNDSTLEIIPFKPRRGRAVWRDLESLRGSAASGAPTSIVRHIAASNELVSQVRQWALITHIHDNAKEVSWSLSRLPWLFLLDRAAGDRCLQFIQRAEDVATTLSRAIKQVADAAIRAQNSQKPLQEVGASQFWSSMEERFAAVLSGTADPERTAAIIVEDALDAFDAAISAVGSAMSAYRSGPEPLAVTIARARLGVGKPRRARTQTSNAGAVTPPGNTDT